MALIACASDKFREVGALRGDLANERIADHLQHRRASTQEEDRAQEHVKLRHVAGDNLRFGPVQPGRHRNQQSRQGDEQADDQHQLLALAILQNAHRHR